MVFAAGAALRSSQVTAIPGVMFSGAVSGYLRTTTSDDSEAKGYCFAAFRAFQGEPNRMIGSGYRSNASIGSFVELNLGADKSFLERFPSANSMTLGSARSHLVSQHERQPRGDRRVFQCVLRLGQAAPTQPSSKGTQPFSSQTMARHSPTIRATMTAACEGMIR